MTRIFGGMNSAPRLRSTDVSMSISFVCSKTDSRWALKPVWLLLWSTNKKPRIVKINSSVTQRDAMNFRIVLTILFTQLPRERFAVHVIPSFWRGSRRTAPRCRQLLPKYWPHCRIPPAMSRDSNPYCTA